MAATAMSPAAPAAVACGVPPLKPSWADLSEDVANSDHETQSARSSWADLSEERSARSSARKSPTKAPTWADLSEGLAWSSDWDEEGLPSSPAWEEPAPKKADGGCGSPGGGSSQQHESQRRRRGGAGGGSAQGGGGRTGRRQERSRASGGTGASGRNAGGDGASRAAAVRRELELLGVVGNVVVVEGLPLRLCSGACLDAMLHQAGVQASVVSYHVEKGSKAGTVRIELCDWYASQQCYTHFAANSWSGANLRVKIEATDGATAGVPAAAETATASDGASQSSQVSLQQASWPAWQGACGGGTGQTWCASSMAASGQEFVMSGCPSGIQGAGWMGQYVAHMPVYGAMPYVAGYN